MTQSFLSEQLLDLWSDLQQPAVFWQVAVLAGCLLVGWILARLIRLGFAAKDSNAGILRIGLESFSRVLSPSIALGLILLIRPILARTQHVNLLNVAIPLVACFVLVRLSLYVLRRVFARTGRVGDAVMVFEKLITLVVWTGFAMYITGLWPDLIDSLEKTVLPLGRNKVSLLTILQAVGSVLLTLLLALWAGAGLEQRLMRLESVHSSLRAVMARMARALLILIAVLVSLSLVGIDLTVLSVFGGALGVGLGLGLQKIVGSYVSGFVILLERSMAVGDMVTVDRFYGQVTRINTRYTVLRGLDGIESVIPNELFVSGPVQNYSLTDRALWLKTQVTVSYDTDIESVLPLLEAAVASIDRVLTKPGVTANLQRFGADGLEVEVGFWIADPENGRSNILSKVNRAIWQTLKNNHIAVPFNQREIRILNDRLPIFMAPTVPVSSDDVTPPSVGADR